MGNSAMATWRKHLFITTAHLTFDAAEHFHLPPQPHHQRRLPHRDQAPPQTDERAHARRAAPPWHRGAAALSQAAPTLCAGTLTARSGMDHALGETFRFALQPLPSVAKRLIRSASALQICHPTQPALRPGRPSANRL